MLIGLYFYIWKPVKGKKKNAQNGPGQENQEKKKYTKSRNA